MTIIAGQLYFRLIKKNVGSYKISKIKFCWLRSIEHIVFVHGSFLIEYFRSPWHWFKEAFTNGNLFGAQACQHLDPIVKISVIEEETIELKMHKSLDFGQSVPRNRYPLVLVANTGNSRLRMIHIRTQGLIFLHQFQNLLK